MKLSNGTVQSCGQVCLCVVQTLLPRIVQLWQGLHVPLVHRSRFYLAFRGRETFYYEAEHRRLIHQQTKVLPACDKHIVCCFTTFNLPPIACRIL